MSGELVPKLRVVRCPKCQLLLPEPPGCVLYKCGECGTTLQAKKRTSVSMNSESSIQDIDAAPRNVLKTKTTTSSGEYHLDGNVGKGQNENGECNVGQLVPCIVSDEGMETELDIYKLSHRRHRVSNKGFSTSYKITHSEIEEIHDENLLEESKEESAFAWDEDGNNDKSSLVGVKSEKEITEGDLEGEEELISESGGEDANKDKSTLAGANPEVQSTGSDAEGAKDLNNGNLLQEGAEEELSSALDGLDANNDKSALVGEYLEVEITGSNIAQELNSERLELEGAEHAFDGEDSNNDESPVEGAKPEVDTKESASTTKRSSRENSGSILHVTPGKLEEVKSSNHVTSNKQQKQAQKNVHRGSNCVRSMDISDTTEIVDHSSELSGVGKLSKSPTNRSSYAYDGSPSSYDGMGDRLSIQNSGSFDNTNTIEHGVSEGRIRKGKGVVNSALPRDLETQHQSHLPNAKHHAMKENRGTQNKVLETTRHGHRRWMRTKRDEFLPKIPFQRSGSHSHYERGGSSYQIHDELYHSTSFLSPDSFEDHQENVKLWRMIHKLQDQLNRTRYMSGETNGRLSKGVSYKGNHVSPYHSLDLHEGRRFAHGLNYPSCNGRCSHGVNWHQRHNKFSRIPYSAEATSSAHHVDHSCYHCCSQEKHFSADMPPHVLFHHEELHRSYPGLDCCSFSHHSYPSSPQWFTKLPPVYGHETKSNDQRHRAPELRKYLRQKKNLAKRHQRPVAGGAPFVTCPKCFKLLQLPADFILFKRACHKLICGECSEVLKFSLHGSHIVYFSPNNAIVPPSCDVDDQSEVISSSNVLPAAHANYYHYSPAEPISYYDDYGLSVSKSYSSEGEPVSLTRFHTLLHSSEHDSRSVSRGTFEPSKEEKITPRCSSLRKATVETDESAIFSTNLSVAKKLSTPPKTSLHLLMGYSSPSQVIRGTRSSV
ncbi:protein ENHANCED DISEASE RESISTANCE 4-like [Abrus precatorius]|uniref:Protein ENHANCED DISEASE RESISTANCE 4-like n=1 Tax=Abrus precatorius TaxID=3816 RepID=A0A8B8K6E4_ABRPR|nr:protein ENHANCED DISEASE RESISTANCE 4-like [Abrus precatorius]